MIGFATFALRMILVLAIGGGLFLIVSLLRLSYKERSTLAGQGYGARVRPQPVRREQRAEQSDRRPPALPRVASAGPYGRGRRREPDRQAGGIA
jgi:hypothetical protein